MSRYEAKQRRMALAVCLGVGAFALAMSTAMRLYPGGNWLDLQAKGHVFFSNFWCDLTQPVSLSGVDNRWGARFAQLGMFCFALALAAFFWSLPQLFSAQERLSRWVRGLGEAAMASFMAVALMPSKVFGDVHAYLALLSGGLGIAAAACAVVALARSREQPLARPLAALGALTLAVGALDAALFTYHLHDATPWLIPAAQKVATFLLLGWMLGSARAVLLRLRKGVIRRP